MSPLVFGGTLLSLAEKRPLAERAATISAAINLWVERLVALLMILLVLDVWLGVVARYALRWQIPWTEELARYLMIWAALLAVSAGVAHREHIGFVMILRKLPAAIQRIFLVSFDVISFTFFIFMAIYGIGMTQTGAKQFAMIFDMSMAWPYAAVPVASLLCAIQVVLVGIRDLGRLDQLDEQEELV